MPEKDIGMRFQPVDGLQAQIRFIADNPCPKVTTLHQVIIGRVYREVFDNMLSTKIPLVAMEGRVCWPSDMDETGFTYEYGQDVHRIMILWQQYCSDHKVNPHQLAQAMAGMGEDSTRVIQSARKLL